MGIVVGYTTERLFFRLLAPSSSDELYLFERRADMNSGILRNEARQFKNFAVPSFVRNGRQFRCAPRASHSRRCSQSHLAIHALISHRFDALALRSIQPCSLDLHFAVDRRDAHGAPAQGDATETESSVPAVRGLSVLWQNCRVVTDRIEPPRHYPSVEYVRKLVDSITIRTEIVAISGRVAR